MNKSIALAYVDAINAQNIEKLYELMAEDHVFIDSHDDRVNGRKVMGKGWVDYFAMFPDYKIEVNDVVESGALVCIFGYAGGTYKNLRNPENSNYWRMPAAWTAIIENQHVKQWQVYCDNTRAIEIINRIEGIPWDTIKQELNENHQSNP